MTCISSRIAAHTPPAYCVVIFYETGAKRDMRTLSCLAAPPAAGFAPSAGAAGARAAGGGAKTEALQVGQFCCLSSHDLRGKPSSSIIHLQCHLRTDCRQVTAHALHKRSCAAAESSSKHKDTTPLRMSCLNHSKLSCVLGQARLHSRRLKVAAACLRWSHAQERLPGL